jgi:hypothetical protein
VSSLWSRRCSSILGVVSLFVEKTITRQSARVTRHAHHQYALMLLPRKSAPLKAGLWDVFHRTSLGCMLLPLPYLAESPPYDLRTLPEALIDWRTRSLLCPLRMAIQKVLEPTSLMPQASAAPVLVRRSGWDLRGVRLGYVHASLEVRVCLSLVTPLLPRRQRL